MSSSDYDKDYSMVLANCCFEKAIDYYEDKKLEKALQAFEEGFKNDPNNIGAHINRAAVYANMNLIDKALRDIRFVLKKDPDNCQALAYKREILKSQANEYVQKKQNAKACQTMAKIFSMDRNLEDRLLRNGYCRCLINYEFDKVMSFLHKCSNKKDKESSSEGSSDSTYYEQSRSKKRKQGKGKESMQERLLRERKSRKYKKEPSSSSSD